MSGGAQESSARLLGTLMVISLIAGVLIAFTFKLTEKPAMPPEMWVPLLIMVLGFYCFFAVSLLLRMRLEVLKRESRASWVKAEVERSL